MDKGSQDFQTRWDPRWSQRLPKKMPGTHSRDFGILEVQKNDKSIPERNER
jgi:hypothetical protein